jgi:putative oxidoreductase
LYYYILVANEKKAMKLKILSTPSDLFPRNRNEIGVAKKAQAKGYMTGDKILSGVSRALLSAIFLAAALDKILHPANTMQYMAANGMTTFTGLFLLCAVVIEILGGLSVLLGYKARLGAMVLVIFLIPTTLIFHRNLSDQVQSIMFLKNLAILGGLLMVIQNEPGRLTVGKNN